MIEIIIVACVVQLFRWIGECRRANRYRGDALDAFAQGNPERYNYHLKRIALAEKLVDQAARALASTAQFTAKEDLEIACEERDLEAIRFFDERRKNVLQQVA